MSRIYDNWERLVAAVLKREELWQLCHENSRSPSICSESSDFISSFSSRLDDDNLKSAYSEFEKAADQVEAEWLEQYAPGVYVRIAALGNGTRKVKRVRISRMMFNEQEAGAWWLKNRENVYKEYRRNKDPNLETNVLKSGNLDLPFEYAHQPEYEFIEFLVALGRNKDPILETNFDEILKSANLDGPLRYAGEPELEWIERYEPGVYVTLVDLKDRRSRDVERVRFSRRKFDAQEAEAWWITNSEKVYERYCWPINLREEPTTPEALEVTRSEYLGPRESEGPGTETAVEPMNRPTSPIRNKRTLHKLIDFIITRN